MLVGQNNVEVEILREIESCGAQRILFWLPGQGQKSCRTLNRMVEDYRLQEAMTLPVQPKPVVVGSGVQEANLLISISL